MIESDVSLTDAPAISGLRFRTFDPERDYEAFVELIHACHLADGIDWLPTEASLRSDDEHATEYDPRRNVLLAEIDGRLVAGARVDVRTREGIGVHQLEGWVRPDRRRQGLGRTLLHWNERRAAAVARVDGRGPERALGAWCDETQAGAIALYESEGYGIVRYNFQMVRDLADPIPDAPLPEGLEIRPVAEADHRPIWDADTEAFRDHWDSGERTEDDFVSWFAEPDLDTSLWRVAWDGGEVAGSVMTFIWSEENEKLGIRRGWLEHVSVRRPWRRRGLASALIADSLRALRAAGMSEGALGVDAENVSGALRVYEALGFRRFRTGLSYRKTFTVE